MAVQTAVPQLPFLSHLITGVKVSNPTSHTTSAFAPYVVLSILRKITLPKDIFVTGPQSIKRIFGNYKYSGLIKNKDKTGKHLLG